VVWHAEQASEYFLANAGIRRFAKLEKLSRAAVGADAGLFNDAV
jgi:hypothetical protein